MPEPCSWLATGQRVLLLGETGRHSLDVYRSAEDDRDWRVMVPMARAESDPCLAWVRAATSACHGPGGIDAYLIPMHLWRRTVSVTGRYLG